MSLRVLVIDDERLIGVTIREYLERQGYAVQWVETAQAGLDQVERDQPDVILLDLQLPDAKGIDLIASFTQHPAHPTSVIIITALPDAKTAVEALRRGAWDYLVKPLDLDELHAKLQRLEKFLNLTTATAVGVPSLSDQNAAHPQLRAAMRLAQEAARTDQALLIVGELGTGRHRLAQMIHRASDRRQEACLSWAANEDRSRVQEQLATLIGAEPGALGTNTSRVRGQLEMVGSGTLILREIQALPPSTQTMLLQLLKNRTYTPLNGRVRAFTGRLIVTATPIIEDPLRSPLISELRRILLGRQIYLPPLRDRQQDFHPLLMELIEELNQEYGKAIRSIEPAAVAALIAHPWHGNIGEMKLVLGRLWPHLEESRLTRRQLPPEFQHRGNSRRPLPEDVPTLADVEKAHILHVMDLVQGNQTQASKILDIARSTLINKLRLYSDSEQPYATSS